MPEATPPTPPAAPAPAPAQRPEDGRSRLWRAFARPHRSQAVVGVLLALVGFAGVTQVRTNTVDDTYSGLRQQDLIDVLDGLAGTTQRAQTEIQRLESTRDDLLDDSVSREAALEEARNQVAVLSVLAGTVPVSGQGISIEVDDGDGQIQVGTFLDLVQALRSAGAEAIEVTGAEDTSVRVVAQSSFETATDGLFVGGRLLAPPYTLEAIGNPDNLVAALRFPDGPQDQVADDGGELSFEERSEVRIEAVADPAAADFAGARQ